MLQTSSLDHIVEDHLFTGMPFSFSDRPEIYGRMLREISRGLKVPREDICVIGSARIGFSLSPYKFGSPFNQHSDVDIIVVSPSLFDPSWIDILTNRHVSWSSLRHFTQAQIKEHREKHHVYRGWIYPALVAEALDIGERWQTTFNGLSRIPFLSSRTIGGRLYRTWEHARAYHRWSLGKIRSKIVGRYNAG